METSETDVAAADEESVEVPMWWTMPFPTEPLYPVDVFLTSRPPRRGERDRRRGAHVRGRNTKAG